MKKRYEITTEEFEVIKEAISKVLDLHSNDCVSAETYEGGGTSMSKETFFEMLKLNFIIKD